MQLTDVLPDLYPRARRRRAQTSVALWSLFGAAAGLIRNFDVGFPLLHAPLRTAGYAAGLGLFGLGYHHLKLEVLRNDYYAKRRLRGARQPQVEQEMGRRGLLAERAGQK